jgi:hypothetical protein
MKITEFHCTEPENSDILPHLTRSFGDGEISGDEEFTTNWGGVFKFDLEKIDIGTTEPYNVWVLSAYLDKGETNADNHS